MTAKKVLIIGGGLSGLAAAHRLMELRESSAVEYKVDLLEAGSRFGGILESHQRFGCMMEAGAESFITEKPWGVELCGRLGIDHLLTGTNPTQRFSYVLTGGRLRRIPEGFYLTAPGNPVSFLLSDLLPVHAKLRVLMEVFIPPRETQEEETVGSFIRRRFGTMCLEKVGQPMIGGIYGGDIERLSLKATFPKFIEMEKQYGSIIKGLFKRSRQDSAKGTAGPRYNLFVSFPEGISFLTDTLKSRIQDKVGLHTATAAEQLRRAGHSWCVMTGDGREFEADAVCLALPPHIQAALLRKTDDALAAGLEQIELTSSITMNLVYSEKDFSRTLEGFGFVVPEGEESSLIGCTFSSRKFSGRAEEGKVLLRAFLRSEFLDVEDRDLEPKIHKELAKLLGITGDPLDFEVNRYRKVMPQYHVGHRAHINAIDEMAAGIPGLYLTGNAFDGVGIPDCIHRAEKQAEAVIQYLNQ